MGAEATLSSVPQIELRGVTKRYGDVTGVARVDLSIGRGEFFSLLGPSGCGKSTILKLIAGFEDPSEGEVFIAGRPMRGIGPERRRTGYVFQNYALFPHMTVAQNVGFGLRARGLDKHSVAKRVRHALDLVELPDLAHRKPGQLSGGQQQRVALARALVIEPEVLLLDEPLAALDRKLRQAMQIKLVELQRKLGVTTIFVTHDQEEALTMSDRIGVMSVEHHRIEQVGKPREIYERPASVRVSKFIGQINLLKEVVQSITPKGGVITANGFNIAQGKGSRPGDSMTVSLRPERIRLHPPDRSVDANFNSIEGVIRESIFVGETINYIVDTADCGRLHAVQLNSDSDSFFETGTSVRLSWAPEAMLVLSRGNDVGE